MEDNQDIKKSIKATSLFGGVQVFSILVSIVRTKIVALLIGPVGVGIVELYNSTIKLITSFTDFSLNVSAVRDVAIAYKSQDEDRLSHIISILSKIVWGTGLLGTFVCLVASPLWSKLTFGNYEYTIGFAILSGTLLLTQLQNGKTVILQATERFKYLAYSGIIGNICGLLTAVPIYYIWGIDGVIAVLFLVALFPYIIVSYFSSKLDIKYENVKIPTVLKEGKTMLKQGFFLSVNFILSTLVFYVLRIFITNRGGIAEVGLYSSSFVIVNTYVGMIFTSMGQEYYPRISSLVENKAKFNDAINSQIYLSLLLLGPMIAFFLVFSNQLLTLLYSDKFVGASMLMALSMLGVVFQAPGWCLGFAFLAKGDNKAFFCFETIAKVFKLVFDLLFYYLWGLTGLGLSFLISFIYYMIQSTIVCRHRYGFRLSLNNIALVLAYFVIGVVILYLIINISLLYRIVIGMVFVAVMSYYSFCKLNTIVDITGFIKNKFSKSND